MTTPPETIWFEELGRGDVARVGGKNASLGEMVRRLGEKGVRVPPGFATTADAYWRYVEANGLRTKIAEAIEDLTAGRATLAEVRPYVEHVIAAFGPERCLWGSDWPVVDTRADLPTWIAAFRTVLAGYSEPEQAAMAHGSASRVYGVTLVS